MHVHRVAHALPGIVGGCTYRRHRTAYPRQIVLASDGQFDVMGSAVEEANIQELLQLGNLMADSRRGEVQLTCRKRKIFSPRDGFERGKA